MIVKQKTELASKIAKIGKIHVTCYTFIQHDTYIKVYKSRRKTRLIG